MKRFCHHCRTRLRWSMMRCPYCRQSTVSRLHLAVFAVCALPAVVYLLRAL